MNSCAWSSSIGKKVVMAVSGLMLSGFLLGHMAGNLLVFLGPNAINSYAKHLLDLGPLLWVARITLLGALIVHVVSSILVSRDNRLARPVSYKKQATIETSVAAKNMLLSGIMIILYLAYHLLHFTFKSAHPELTHFKDAFGHHDVYRMVVTSFQNPWIAGIYILSMICLCLHLSHALSSIFQTIGINSPSFARKIKFAGSMIAGLIFLGYTSIPVAALTGVLKLGPAVHL